MSTTAVTGQFICVAKKEWIAIAADNDELPISNLGALRFGLEALQTEDARDEQRSEQLWAKAESVLAKETSDDTGAGAEGRANVIDDWDMAAVIGGSLDGGGWYW